MAPLVFIGITSLFIIHSTLALATPGGTMQRRILVTGANTGIGLALTKQLVADHGCHVYLGARNVDKGAKAVAEVKSTSGDSVELLNIDVANAASVKSAASEFAQRLGDDKLYAIVNNAGAGFRQQPDEIVETNVRGPRRVVDHFLPLLDPKEGRIVNLGSGGGPNFVNGLESASDKRRYVSKMSEEEIEAEAATIEASGDGSYAYRGSKALLACYTMDLAERHPHLLVSIVTPGWIKTQMTAGTAASKEPAEGTVALKKCLFEELPASGYFWGSDGRRSPLHYMRNPGEQEYDGTTPTFN